MYLQKFENKDYFQFFSLPTCSSKSTLVDSPLSRNIYLCGFYYTKDNQDPRENEMKIPINFKIIF